MIKIAKHIPIPTGHRIKYPWDRMKPGDSFAVPMAKAGSLKAVASHRNATGDARYIVRVMGKIARCWRVR